MEMELFSTQAALVSAEAQSAVIEQQIIAEVDKELERLRRLRPGLDGLQRQLKADEANYLRLFNQGRDDPTSRL